MNDKAEIADDFFFVTVALNLKQPMPESDFFNVENFVNEKVPNSVLFKVPLITDSATRKMLRNLDVT